MIQTAESYSHVLNKHRHINAVSCYVKATDSDNSKRYPYNMQCRHKMGLEVLLYLFLT